VNGNMGAITTHILDVSQGRPAADVRVLLERLDGDTPHRLGEGRTDSDGRQRTLVREGTTLERGVYRLTFAIGEYFAAMHVETLYPSVQVTFEVKDAGQHYHVPLLISPFGYSTYRGS
jgi:5-hydroxyisourate hydrolase